MKTKTCGECKYYDQNGYCEFLDFEPKKEMGGCSNFQQKPTNGDVIRQMSNEELANQLLLNTQCVFCSITKFCQNVRKNRTCQEVWLDWLNAPAESEGER